MAKTTRQTSAQRKNKAAKKGVRGKKKTTKKPAAKKKTTRKKASKKKTAKKKPAAKKKTGEKKTSKGKPAAKPPDQPLSSQDAPKVEDPPPTTPDEPNAKEGPPPSPENLETQNSVWHHYQQLGSIRRVAAELNISEWIVRRIIQQDQDRLATWKNERQEEIVAEWERQGREAQVLTGDMLCIVKGFLDEIKAAYSENRLTNILDKKGIPLSPMDAIEFIIVQRALDQSIALATKAGQISLAYRSGKESIDDPQESSAGGFIQDLGAMPDAEKVKLFEDAGMPIPAFFRLKLTQREEEQKRLENTDAG